jgi:hypothetical protein
MTNDANAAMSSGCDAISLERPGRGHAGYGRRDEAAESPAVANYRF